MATFKTTDEIIEIVRGLLGAITVPKHLQTKPTPKAGDAPVSEYIVINALPINADVMQKCYVNVNYHVKDIAPGVKDTTKIKAGSSSVMALLKEVSGTSYMIDFENQVTFREEALGEHYSNMRFSFKYINN
jgi:hypothetical protein